MGWVLDEALLTEGYVSGPLKVSQFAAFSAPVPVFASATTVAGAGAVDLGGVVAAHAGSLATEHVAGTREAERVLVGLPADRTSIATAILVRGDRTVASNQVAVPLERARLLDPALAASIASIRHHDGFPRAQIAHPIAPDADLRDEMLFEAPADPARRWYLPRYRVATERLNDGTVRFAIRLAAREPGWALTIRLQPYPAPSIAGDATAAQELPHEVAVILRYRLAGTGIEKELPFGDRAAGPDGVTAALQLPTLPEASEVFFALTEPAANAELVVRRLFQVAIPVPPPPPNPDEVPWEPLLVRPLEIPRELLVPVEPGEPIPPEEVRVDPGMVRVLPQGIDLSAIEAVLRGGRLGGFGLEGRTVHLRGIGDSRVRDVLAVDRKIFDGAPNKPEPHYRVVHRTLDDRPEPHPFFFPVNAHGYVFEGFAAVGAAPASSIPHQLSWMGRSHTYYQEASRRHVFYYLPDSFKLARSPEAPHQLVFRVTFTSEDGELEGMRAIVRFFAAPYVDRGRLEAASAALGAEDLGGAAAPVLQPLIAGREDLSFAMVLPGAGTASVVGDAIVDVRLGFTASLDLSLADFQALFDALFAGGGSPLFSGAVRVAVGRDGRPAEQVPFRARLDDTAGELFEYRRDPPTGEGVRVTLQNAIESPVRIDALDASLVRAGGAVPTAVTGLDFPVDRLAPGESVGCTVGADVTPRPAAEEPVLFGVAGVRVLPDPEAVWASIADRSTSAFVRRVAVLAPVTLFDASAADPLLEIDVEIGLASGGLTKTVVLNAGQPAMEVPVPFPLADVVLGRPDVGTVRYRVRGIRASGQTVRDWRTETTDRIWITAPDVA